MPPLTSLTTESAIMGPGNRTNPDLTGAGGLFGWDVVAGYYRVRTEKAGCSAPGGGAYAETDVLTIPPPITDLALVLDCAVNRAPSGANKTISLISNGTYAFSVADFGFSDANDSPAEHPSGCKDLNAPKCRLAEAWRRGCQRR